MSGNYQYLYYLYHTDCLLIIKMIKSKRNILETILWSHKF